MIDERPQEPPTEPPTEGVRGSTSVELSNMLEKGMVVDSAVPIVPATQAPTEIAQPPSALLGTPEPPTEAPQAPSE